MRMRSPERELWALLRSKQLDAIQSGGQDRRSAGAAVGGVRSMRRLAQERRRGFVGGSSFMSRNSMTSTTAS